MSEKYLLSQLQAWAKANHGALKQAMRGDWVRTQRRGQGLQSRQLAQRLAVSPARISVLERDEASGAVTLKMMQRAAHALDCELVYMLVPRDALSAEAERKPRIKIRQLHD